MTCIGAQPGWFEDSFSFKFGLPGSAGSVPTVLHDATDTGTEYILKHLMVVGPKGGKMMPMQRTQEQIAFWAGVKGAKMIPRDIKTQEK